MICEGASDAAAGCDLGLACVGRFSCSHGAGLLFELVRGQRPGQVVLIADADEPGRRGAEQLAAVLLPYVPVLKVITPPAPYRDLRAWRRAGAKPQDIENLLARTEPRRLTVNVRYPR